MAFSPFVSALTIRLRRHDTFEDRAPMLDDPEVQNTCQQQKAQ
jgi:hypothetical protein